MAIVMTYYRENGKIGGYVDDSCVVKTEEEVRAILDNCNRIYTEACIRQAMKERSLNNEKGQYKDQDSGRSEVQLTSAGQSRL